jgi:hypothetical protein
MPQNEFSNIVSSPTDIAQVGIGNLLTAQGATPDEVNNVFGRYTSAAPIGTTGDALYPQPVDDGDDDDDDDDMEIGTDPIEVPSFNAGGIYDPGGDLDPLGGEGWEAIDPKTGEKYGIGGMGRWAVDRGAAFQKTVEKVRGELWDIVTGKEPVVPNKNVPITLGDENTDIAAINATAAQNALDQGRIDPGISGDAPSVSGGSASGASAGGNFDATGGFGDYDFKASGGTVTKSKAKNKNSFMSMKGK